MKLSAITLHPIQPMICLSCLILVYYFLYFRINFYLFGDWNNRLSMDPSVIKDPDIERLHKMYGGINVSSEITFVTAYFNIGDFAKGVNQQYTPDLYKKWMTVYGRISNPLIVFLDSQNLKHMFEDIRSIFPKNFTQIYVVPREQLWAFSIARDIKEIFNQPNYPQIHPNTVNENYSCVMHAKFELVNKVIRENLAKTRYIGWIDIGLFRQNTAETHIFHLNLPVGFDETKVAYSQLNPFDETLTPMEVVRSNLVWVAGGMFIGNYYTMYLYTKDYMKVVKLLLDNRIMSTDQQVIYSMYLPSIDYKPRVQLQLYTTYSHDDWFYLKYLMKSQWERQQINDKLMLLQFFYRLL